MKNGRINLKHTQLYYLNNLLHRCGFLIYYSFTLCQFSLSYWLVFVKGVQGICHHGTISEELETNESNQLIKQ